MPAATSLLAASAALGGGAGFFGAYQQSKAQREQAEFENNQRQANARLAEMQAEESIKRGASESNKAIRSGQQMIGEQRVALAQQGIDINTGSAGDIQSETDAISHQDAETIKNNAWREAWGFKTQAAEDRGRGKMALATGRATAFNTMLTGGLNAASQFASAGANVAERLSAGKTKSQSFDIPSSEDFKQPEFGGSLSRKAKYLKY